MYGSIFKELGKNLFARLSKTKRNYCYYSISLKKMVFNKCFDVSTYIEINIY